MPHHGPLLVVGGLVRVLDVGPAQTYAVTVRAAAIATSMAEASVTEACCHAHGMTRGGGRGRWCGRRVGPACLSMYLLLMLGHGTAQQLWTHGKHHEQRAHVPLPLTLTSPTQFGLSVCQSAGGASVNRFVPDSISTKLSACRGENGAPASLSAVHTPPAPAPSSPPMPTDTHNHPHAHTTRTTRTNTRQREPPPPP